MPSRVALRMRTARTLKVIAEHLILLLPMVKYVRENGHKFTTLRYLTSVNADIVTLHN